MKNSKSLFSLLLFLFLPVLFKVSAQSNDLLLGEAAYQKGDYVMTLTALNRFLGSNQSIPAEDLARAFFYRGSAWMKLYFQSKQLGDPELLEEFREAPYKALLDFQEGLKPGIARYKALIDAEINTTAMMALSEASVLLSEYARNPDADLAVLKTTIAWCSAAIATGVNVFYGLDLRGQAHRLNGQTEAAIRDYRQSLDIFANNPPANPDLNIGYSAYSLASLLLSQPGKTREALQATLDGLTLLRSEWKRTEDKKAKMTSLAFETARQSFEQSVYDLLDLAISLVRKEEKLSPLVEEKFRLLLESFPEDFSIALAYGDLLALNNYEGAREQYMKVSRLDPARWETYFNLGVLCNNRAVYYNNLLNVEMEAGTRAAYGQKVQEYLNETILWFEKANQISPANKEPVQALKNLHQATGNTAEYLRYLEMEKRIESR